MHLIDYQFFFHILRCNFGNNFPFRVSFDFFHSTSCTEYSDASRPDTRTPVRRAQILFISVDCDYALFFVIDKIYTEYIEFIICGGSGGDL